MTDFDQKLLDKFIMIIITDFNEVHNKISYHKHLLSNIIGKSSKLNYSNLIAYYCLIIDVEELNVLNCCVKIITL